MGHESIVPPPLIDTVALHHHFSDVSHSWYRAFYYQEITFLENLPKWLGNFISTSTSPENSLITCQCQGTAIVLL